MAQSRLGGDATEKLNSGGGGFAVQWPGGLAAGDFALLAMSWNEANDDSVVIEPTGFTRIGTTLVIGGAGNAESRVEVWYKHVVGSESGDIDMGRASIAFWGNALLDVYRGNGALTFNSATVGTPGTGTSATIPNMTGANGQIQLAVVAISDPSTASDNTADMAKGTSGLQNTNTGFTYYAFLTGDIAAQTVTLGTSRDHVGISVLVDDAGAGGGARKIILTRPA
jgi:hypothetical protein